MSAAKLTEFVMRNAEKNHQRTGQYLFNCLPNEVARWVGGMLFDPFFQEMAKDEVAAWIDHHLIFDGEIIIAVFNGNTILWERT